MSRFYAIYCNDSDDFLIDVDSGWGWSHLQGAFLDLNRGWNVYDDVFHDSAKFSTVDAAEAIASKMGNEFISNGFSVDFMVHEIEIAEQETKIDGRLIESKSIYRVLSNNPLANVKIDVRDAKRSTACQVIFERIVECHGVHGLNLNEEEDVANLAKAIESALLDEDCI